MGRISGRPPYNHVIIAIPVFAIAILLATNPLEEQMNLDIRITQCALKRIELEKKRFAGDSEFFHDLAKSFSGMGLFACAFVRISPILMIIYSFCNIGILDFTAEQLFMPGWAVPLTSGAIFSLATLYFGRLACAPYRKL